MRKGYLNFLEVLRLQLNLVPPKDFYTSWAFSCYGSWGDIIGRCSINYCYLDYYRGKEI